MAISEEESVGSCRKIRFEEASTDAIGGLSDLPESVILNILSYLETKSAVRTSVLSQQWRSLWTLVPTLSLSTYDFPLFAEFQQFLEKALDRHDKLNKLQLYLHDSDIWQRKDPLREHVDSWLQHAANRDVGTLDLDVFWNYRLPEFLFAHSPLTKLSTRRCIYEPTTRVSWGSLTSLSIGFSQISFEDLTSILSGSPVLQHLELISYSLYANSEVHDIVSCSLKKLVLDCMHSAVKFSAPNLEILEISDHLAAMVMGQVDLLYLPALVEANLKPT